MQGRIATPYAPCKHYRWECCHGKQYSLPRNFFLFLLKKFMIFWWRAHSLQFGCENQDSPAAVGMFQTNSGMNEYRGNQTTWHKNYWTVIYSLCMYLCEGAHGAVSAFQSPAATSNSVGKDGKCVQLKLCPFIDWRVDVKSWLSSHFMSLSDKNWFFFPLLTEVFPGIWINNEQDHCKITARWISWESEEQNVFVHRFRVVAIGASLANW